MSQGSSDGGDSGTPDMSGKPPGSTCTGDGECMGGACKAVGEGGATICVAACTSQSDCAALPGGLFCEPKAAGSSEGYCIPPSPLHCAVCTRDRDCGVLAESCSLVPGDIAPACHIDCSLSTAACPADYTCQTVNQGPAGTARKLCVPKLNVCLDALGGFCDRGIELPQPCQRTNDAGICIGQRVCLPAGRFDRCGASVPQYLYCGQMATPGCTLKLAPDATNDRNNCGACGHACGSSEDCCNRVCAPLNTAANCGACGRACASGSDCCGGACTSIGTPQNCGACGRACPGLGSSTSDPYCDASRTCGMSCRGDNYDVDQRLDNGCEILDILPPGHTQSSASYRGEKDCWDGSSSDTFDEYLMSDRRAHANPPVVPWNGTVGAAPEWWKVRATGGVCTNDYLVTFSTSGGSALSCYTLTIFTNKGSNSVTISGNSWNSMSGGTSSYSSDSDIYFLVEKTCTSPSPERVHYTVSYHL